MNFQSLLTEIPKLAPVRSEDWRLEWLFAAAHESVSGPERNLLRDSDTSGIGGKADER